MRLGTDMIYAEDNARGTRFHGFVLDDWTPGRRPVVTVDVLPVPPPASGAGPCAYAFPSAGCVVRVTLHGGSPRYEVYATALWRAMEAWRAFADPQYEPLVLHEGRIVELAAT
jgi:hypothetical protein